MSTAFVRINTTEDAEYFLHVDRISSFHKSTTDAHGEATEVQTVYGNTFYVDKSVDEFAADIRTAIYNFTFFG